MQEDPMPLADDDDMTPPIEDRAADPVEDVDPQPASEQPIEVGPAEADAFTNDASSPYEPALTVPEILDVSAPEPVAAEEPHAPIWKRLFERPERRPMPPLYDEDGSDAGSDDDYYRPEPEPAPAAPTTSEVPADDARAPEPEAQPEPFAMPGPETVSAPESEPKQGLFNRLPFHRKKTQAEAEAEIVPVVPEVAPEADETTEPPADAFFLTGAASATEESGSEAPRPETFATEEIPPHALPDEAAPADEPAPVTIPHEEFDAVRSALQQPTQEFPVVLPVGASAGISEETAVFPASDESATTIFDLPAREVEDHAPRMSPIFAVIRVLALPRSTFDAVIEEGVNAWPAALAIVLIATVVKTGIAIAFAAQGEVPTSALFAVAVRYGVALVGPLAAAALAAAWIVVVQRLWEGDGTYGRVLSVTSLALVPLALRSLLQAGFMAATRTVLVHPGLSAFIAPPPLGLAGRLGYAVLGGIDLFTIWAFALLLLAPRATHGRGRLRGVLMMVLFGALALLVMAVPSLLVAPALRF